MSFCFLLLLHFIVFKSASCHIITTAVFKIWESSGWFLVMAPLPRIFQTLGQNSSYSVILSQNNLQETLKLNDFCLSTL